LQVAESVLRQALERFPRSVRLHIQLAAVLEGEHHGKEARRVVAEVIGLELGASEDGERFRYNTTSPESFAEARHFVAENARARLPVLAQAVAGSTAMAAVPGGGA
ncbi:MAG: hypothetical protein M3O15_09135, partial [Acidobacteriota bacterium]|nr:hypothetical protein [Acidobacteriota bacterium]